MRVLARDEIPADTAVLSMPGALAITADLGRDALHALLGSSTADDEGVTERMWVCLYIVMHWVAPDEAV